MMWRGIGFGSTVLIFVLASFGAAHARPARRLAREAEPLALPPVDSVIETAPPSFSPDGEDPAKLSRTETISLVRKYAADIARSLLEGERARERAVSEKDYIRLSCIQDRLSQMKTIKKLSDERLAATDRPAIRADELNLRHEFRGVELAHQRVLELYRELRDCVGENLEVTGGPGPDAPGVPADPGASSVESPRTDRPLAASPIN
jgi:hypothetical protein